MSVWMIELRDGRTSCELFVGKRYDLLEPEDQDLWRLIDTVKQLWEKALVLCRTIQIIRSRRVDVPRAD